MMKKYNTPVIETLALETIDVIATSGNKAAEEALAAKGYVADGAKVLDAKADFQPSKWTW